MDNIIFGIRPVAEAIEAGRQIEKLYIRKGAEGQLMTELKDLCIRHRVRMQEVPVEKLNRLTRGNHQGVVAQISAIEYVGLADILERVPEDETPLVVIFDGVTDVRNFGAIARSAECAGAHGLVTPLKNSAPVNAEAIRSSAGALTTIPVCRVGSIRNTIKQLQTEGFQIVAATEKSRKLLYDADFRKPTALVMGAEDTGISKEVLKLCDEQLAIPLIGHIESLNVRDAFRGRAPAYRTINENHESETRTLRAVASGGVPANAAPAPCGGGIDCPRMYRLPRRLRDGQRRHPGQAGARAAGLRCCAGLQ